MKLIHTLLPAVALLFILDFATAQRQQQRCHRPCVYNTMDNCTAACPGTCQQEDTFYICNNTCEESCEGENATCLDLPGKKSRCVFTECPTPCPGEDCVTITVADQTFCKFNCSRSEQPADDDEEAGTEGECRHSGGKRGSGAAKKSAAKKSAAKKSAAKKSAAKKSAAKKSAAKKSAAKKSAAKESAAKESEAKKSASKKSASKKSASKKSSQVGKRADGERAGGESRPSGDSAGGKRPGSGGERGTGGAGRSGGRSRGRAKGR